MISRFFCILIFCAALPCFADQLAFSRVPSPGESFLFSCRQSEESTSSMVVRGAKNPPRRTDTRQIVLNGVWTLKNRDESTFRISSCRILINGKDIAESSWQGKTLRLIRRENGTVDASFIPENKRDQTDLNALLNDPGANSKPLKVTGELQSLLNDLFAKDGSRNFARIFGPDADRKAGETWTPQTNWIQDLMAKQQIHTVPDDWIAKAAYTGMADLQGEKVHAASYSLMSRHIPGCEVKLDAVYCFPPAGKSGPFRIAQNAAVVIDHVLPEENPVFSGTKFMLVRTASSELILIPGK